MIAKVLYNTGSQILGKGFTAASTLIVTLLIGRLLGPSGFGQFTKVFVFVGYFYTFVDFGLNSIYVKITDSRSQFPYLKALFGLRLLMAILFAILAVIIALVVPYSEALGTGFSPLVKAGIFIAAITIVTQALFTTANAFFQRNLRYDLSTLAAIAGSAAILLATLVISVVGASILGYVFAYVFGGVVLVFVAYFLIYKKWDFLIIPRFNRSISKKLIVASWPVGLALIFNLIYFRIDIFILANTRSTAEVGLYGLAYQFFEASLAVPIFFVNAIYPVLASVYKSNFGKFKNQVKFWMAVLLLASLGLGIFLYLISFLIPSIYDVRFTASQFPLRILAFGMPFFFISALFWHLLIIYGRQKFLVLVYVLGAIFNLTANIIFIPRFGIVAAATTTILSEVLILILLVIILFRITKDGEALVFG